MPFLRGKRVRKGKGRDVKLIDLSELGKRTTTTNKEVYRKAEIVPSFAQKWIIARRRTSKHFTLMLQQNGIMFRPGRKFRNTIFPLRFLLQILLHVCRQTIGFSYT